MRNTFLIQCPRRMRINFLLLTLCVFLFSFVEGYAQSGTSESFSWNNEGIGNTSEAVRVVRYYRGDSIRQIEKRVIVQFRGETLADLYKQHDNKISSDREKARLKAEQAAIFDQFETDLEQIGKAGFKVQGKTQAYFMKCRTGRKYSLTYFGQQLTLDSMMIPAIEKLPYVKAVHPDRKVKSSLEESVPQIGADSVWRELDCEADSIRVGILDTGIDYTHPDLGGGFGPGYKVIGGYDFVNLDEDPMDDHSHGTHVAGIVAANGTLRGVAPGALLYALKVLDGSGSGYESDIIAAIEYSVDPNGDEDISDHLDVANMSLGGEPTLEDPMVDAVEAAVSLGVSYCIAAGNEGRDGNSSIGSPGCSPSAITVGAVEKNNTLAYFSSLGPTDFTYQLKPDLLAPGVDINSTVPDQSYESFSGTSMATPHVAGACALLKKLHPDWGPSRLKAALMSTCLDLGYEPLSQGAGLINVYRAARVQTYMDKSMLYFGLDSLAEDAHWQVTDSITLENPGSETREYTLSELAPQPGISLSYPASFSLAPGEQITLPVSIDVDNSMLTSEATQAISYSGFLSLNCDQDSLHLNWAFLRSFLLRFDGDFGLQNLYVFNENKLLIPWILPWEPLPEFLLKPGKYYVFAELSDTAESYNNITRYVIIKEVNMQENTLLTLHRTEAKNRIIYDTEDLQGMKYSEKLAKSRGAIFDLPGSFLLETIRYSENTPGRAGWFSGSFGYPENMHMIRSEATAMLADEASFCLYDTLYYSDLPEGTLVSVSEARRKIDAEYKFCFNEEGPMEPQDTITLTSRASDYSTLHFTNNYPGKPSMWYPKLFWKTERPDDIGYWLEGGADPVGASYSLSLTPKSDVERDKFHYFTIMREFDYITIPVQYIEGQFVVGNGKTAGALYFDPGDTVPSNSGPWSACILNSQFRSKLEFYPHMQGAMGETSIQINATGKTYTAEGEPIDSGGMAVLENIPGKYRIELSINNGQRIYGKKTENFIQSFIDTELEDHKPPAVRYLSFRDHEGRPVSYVPTGDSVSLYFTLSGEENFEGYEGSGTEVPFDSVWVNYKLSDSTHWHPLPVDSLGYDWRDGLTCSGILRSTDTDSAHIDLMINTVDAAGNKTLTCISPALYIKNIQSPSAGQDAYKFAPGRKYRSDHSILDNDSDPFGLTTSLAINIVTPPEHGKLVMASTGNFTYNPDDDFEGIDQFTYRVKNELYYSAPAGVTLDMTPDVLNNPVLRNGDGFWLYPNPASDHIHIGLRLKESSEVQVSLYTMSGTRIMDIFSGMLIDGEHQIEWDTRTNLLPGLYLVTVQSQTLNECTKLIIQ